MELLSSLIPINSERITTLEEDLPSTAQVYLRICSIGLVEGRAFTGLVLAKLGFSVGSPLSISLRSVTTLLKFVPVRVLVFTLLCLLTGPFVIAICPVPALRTLLVPFIVVVRLTIGTIVILSPIEL